jgi:hypothetical protein
MQQAWDTPSAQKTGFQAISCSWPASRQQTTFKRDIIPKIHAALVTLPDNKNEGLFMLSADAK